GLWAQWLLVGMQRGAFRGYGRNFQEATHKLSRGAPPEHAGAKSAGMGAAITVAPLGAVYRGPPEELRDVAVGSSLVTHSDSRAGALAYAIARAVPLLVTGVPLSEVRRRLPSDVDMVEMEWLHGHRGWGIDRSAGNVVSESIAAILEQDFPDFDT